MPQTDTTSTSESSTPPLLCFEPVRLQTPMSADRVLETVRGLSKRGKLPGFESGGTGGALFSVAAHGKPFDSDLLFNAEEAESGSVLLGRVRMKRTMPWVFGLVTALTIWPGVVLTDAMLNTWFGWYPNAMWVTYAWYMPMTVLPLPWMVKRVVRQSRQSAAEHAAETAEKIAKAIDGVVLRDR